MLLYNNNVIERTDMWELIRTLLLLSLSQRVIKTTSSVLDTHSLIVIVPAGTSGHNEYWGGLQNIINKSPFSTRALLCWFK